jgi:hypothetical protein
MRGSVRQFAPLLLAATYAVLWTCGSAWHMANCTHCEFAADSSCRCESVKKSSSCCGNHAATGHGSHASSKCEGNANDVSSSSSGQPQETPDAPHDSSHCEICHLLAQALTVVSLVSIEVSPEWVENSACLIPLTVPECELIPATSRGPPVMA